ncbi:MAG: hypothetical protein DDT42_00006 [candidate division WS2 bacterium]|uniref:Diphthamide synthase domain-containing protein n=1 Tax=Psychracetigena formicireducens TaxID=2986056 RepID=A0A9E2BJD9_PSYF1|nr:hypothetical protein [Candidatus Psychracetigena formicireducens]MBT9144174.1 hypothetical protein [Candidatus Psychracetigena formicireducens]
MGGIKAFCCWSGGKESSLSFYKARKSGINSTYLLNMVSEDGEYSRSHGIYSDLLRLQAEAIGIPILQRRTTWEDYEEVFKEAVSYLKQERIQAGIFGDIDLQEHRDWVERVCKESNIKSKLPLWKWKREELLEEFIQIGFKAVVVATQSDSLSKEWLGREIDEEFVADLKEMKVDLCGERGEYHTFVYDGPIFSRPVRFMLGKKIQRGKNHFLELIPNRKS